MMAKTNHRIFYQETEINTLRNNVKSAYKEYTKNNKNLSGIIFDDTSYKLSAHYNKLVELLEIHCSSFKRGETQILSNTTLHKFFTAPSTQKNNQTGFNFEKRTIEILTNFSSTFQTSQAQTISSSNNTNNYSEQEILDEARALQNHYEQDEIDIGVSKANDAYEKYGSHPQILKHVFRFNMRKKEWELIRGIVEKVLKENPSDIVTTQCYLTLFECELREANSLHKSNRTEQSKKILYGKNLLNKVPKSQHEYEQYLYWNGKWYLELWHSSNGDDITHLKQAQSCFEKAISKKYTWWYHCYKCIILKLLNNKTFKKEVKKFTDYIIEEKNRQPNRPAVRTYRITSFVLNDDMRGLKAFLGEHNVPSSATDFQFTIFHHVELIFYTDPKKQAAYKKVLENWISHLPIK